MNNLLNNTRKAYLKGRRFSNDAQNLNLNNYYLNFGPQHPAAHGVFETGIELNGEFSS